MRKLAAFIFGFLATQALAVFPSTIDDFNATYGTIATGQTIQAGWFNDPWATIKALETKTGIDSSGVTTSLDYLSKIPLGATVRTVGASGCKYTSFTTAVAACSSGDTVFVTPGSYTIADGELDIADGVSVVGANKMTCKLVWNSGTALLYLKGHNLLSNLYLQRTTSTSGSGELHADGQDIIVENNVFYGSIDVMHINSGINGGSLWIYNNKLILPVFDIWVGLSGIDNTASIYVVGNQSYMTGGTQGWTYLKSQKAGNVVIADNVVNWESSTASIVGNFLTCVMDSAATRHTVLSSNNRVRCYNSATSGLGTSAAFTLSTNDSGVSSGIIPDFLSVNDQFEFTSQSQAKLFANTNSAAGSIANWGQWRVENCTGRWQKSSTAGIWAPLTVSGTHNTSTTPVMTWDGPRSVGTVAAAGTTTTDAAFLPYSNNRVTGATNATGVRLDPSQFRVFIRNDDATHTLNVYPPSGKTINGGSADAAISIAAATSVILSQYDGAKWFSE